MRHVIFTEFEHFPERVLQDSLKLFDERRLTFASRILGKYKLRELIALQDMFYDIDTDHNGEICLAEFVNHFPHELHTSRVFSQIDQNEDGEISFSEILVTKYPTMSKDELRRILELLHRPLVKNALVEELAQIFSRLFELEKNDQNKVDFGKKKVCVRWLVATFSNMRNWFVQSLHLASTLDVRQLTESISLSDLMTALFRPTHTEEEIIRFTKIGELKLFSLASGRNSEHEK